MNGGVSDEYMRGVGGDGIANGVIEGKHAGHCGHLEGGLRLSIGNVRVGG